MKLSLKTSMDVRQILTFGSLMEVRNIVKKMFHL